MRGARETAQMIVSAAADRGMAGRAGNGTVLLTTSIAGSGEAGAQEAARAIYDMLEGTADRLASQMGAGDPNFSS